jgi:hypothetical protein
MRMRGGPPRPADLVSPALDITQERTAMKQEGKIVWRSGQHGYEKRAILIDESGVVLHEGRIVPYTFSETGDETSARESSARDVIDWAAANGVVVLADGFGTLGNEIAGNETNAAGGGPSRLPLR